MPRERAWEQVSQRCILGWGGLLWARRRGSRPKYRQLDMTAHRQCLRWLVLVQGIQGRMVVPLLQLCGDRTNNGAVVWCLTWKQPYSA